MLFSRGNPHKCGGRLGTANMSSSNIPRKPLIQVWMRLRQGWTFGKLISLFWTSCWLHRQVPPTLAGVIRTFPATHCKELECWQLHISIEGMISKGHCCICIKIEIVKHLHPRLLHLTPGSHDFGHVHFSLILEPKTGWRFLESNKTRSSKVGVFAEQKSHCASMVVLGG